MADQVLATPVSRIEPVDRQRIRRPRSVPGRRPSDYLALAPIGIVILAAMIGPLLSVDPAAQDLTNRLLPPVFLDGTWDHPLGTDGLGRDILARLFEAARLSLVVGAIAASISAVVGVAAGLMAGSVGGVPDRVTTALVELVLSIPTIVVGIVLTATLGQNMTNLVLILVISGWIGYARVVRLVVRQLMHSGFVTAAHASGAGAMRIARYHLFPNVMPTVIVLFFQQVAAVMLWEASLTYLGIGLPIERISLGGMIKEGQQHVFDGWWIGVFPGAMIALAVIGFTMLADWLQSEFDPVRGRRHRVV